MIPDDKVADFVLKAWGVWPPGVEDEGEADARMPNQPDVPGFIPQLLRRRLSPLARAVFHAIGTCVAPEEQLPTVFSSAHGEVGTALQMLQMIQAGEELSPTAFSLSVHNAIAGLYAIAYHNQHEMTVLAPGRQGVAPAFIEALGMLQEGAERQVLVVLYDEPLAAFFPVAPFKLNADVTCALALRLSLQGTGMAMRLSRGTEVRDDGEQPQQLALLIDFLQSHRQTITLGYQGQSWRWQKI